MSKWKILLVFLSALFGGCNGVVKPTPIVSTELKPADIKVTYWDGGLRGVRMAVPLTPNHLRKTGTSSSISSSELYRRLLDVSKLDCKMQRTENLVALAVTKDSEVYVLFNKQIATKQGVCDMPFSEADKLIKQLGLNFKHHKKGYNMY